jgi:hypothetical protein
MTAMTGAQFETRSDRQAREHRDWVATGVAYLIGLSIYAVEEQDEAKDLMECLWWDSRDEGGEMMCTPQEAVDEELTYWGD